MLKNINLFFFITFLRIYLMLFVTKNFNSSHATVTKLIKTINRAKLIKSKSVDFIGFY